MKVKAATVEQHQFAVRRRGYDRAEVDAVMGRLSLSLRRYEEEVGQLEARLDRAGTTGNAIADSVAQTARGERLEHRTEGEQTMTQAEDALTSARQQAEAILESARGEIVTMFDSLAAETEQVLAAANNDAAALRHNADQDAKALIDDATAEAGRLRAEAAAARAEADSVRRIAQEEAEAVRQAVAAEADKLMSEATSEAAEILERARSEHDRLATRIPELRSALSQFEAQVHALAAEPAAVDLNAIEAEEHAQAAQVAAAVSEAVAEVGVATVAAGEVETESAVAATFDESLDLTDAIPVPDGSGTLPAARDLVDLDEYRDLKVIKVESAPAPEEPATEPVAESETDQIPAAAGSPPLERLAATHVARRGMGAADETIYQRRGGGLRRRIKAQGDQE